MIFYDFDIESNLDSFAGNQTPGADELPWITVHRGESGEPKSSKGCGDAYALEKKIGFRIMIKEESCVPDILTRGIAYQALHVANQVWF